MRWWHFGDIRRAFDYVLRGVSGFIYARVFVFLRLTLSVWLSACIYIYVCVCFAAVWSFFFMAIGLRGKWLDFVSGCSFWWDILRRWAEDGCSAVVNAPL